MKRSNTFDRCSNELKKLPGVGRKTAVRLALHFISLDSSDIKNLTDSIVSLNERTSECTICGCLTESKICEICTDKARDQSILCVVENVNDVFIIESTKRYSGLYHVLGGTISPLDGVGPDDLAINGLITRITDKINEVIIATNPDVEGETTAIYLAKKLRQLHQIFITRIASGVPTGGSIEYADEITVLKSLENRREFI